jgi:2-keto-4-pentenoate hydratase
MPAMETKKPDQNLSAALRRQLDLWRAALEGGAERVGWKIGFNVPAAMERIGIEEPIVGHLTTATKLSDGAEFFPRDAADLRAECEIAIRVGDDGAVTGYAPAIELVDLGSPADGAEGIIAGNIFHRAFVIGTFADTPPEGTAFLAVGEDAHEAAQPVPDFEETVALVARRLAAAGEELKAGDVIISGALVVVGVQPGDDLTADIAGLGTVSVGIR